MEEPTTGRLPKEIRVGDTLLPVNKNIIDKLVNEGMDNLSLVRAMGNYDSKLHRSWTIAIMILSLVEWGTAGEIKE